MSMLNPLQHQQSGSRPSPLVLLGLSAVVAFAIIFGYVMIRQAGTGFVSVDADPDDASSTESMTLVQPFESAEEFKQWLEDAGTAESAYGYGGRMRNMAVDMMPVMAPSAGLDLGVTTESAGIGTAVAPTSPERVSETNVQVVGIDEPDILKTDGREIYYSQEMNYRWMGGIRLMPATDMLVRSSIASMPPLYRPTGTRIIEAFPPTALKEASTIELNGNLLLQDKTLIVFDYEGLHAYDVNNPTLPIEKWKNAYGDNQEYVAARLYQGKIFLVTRGYLNYDMPCPIQPLKGVTVPVEIACGQVWHPISPIPTEVTYSVLTLDAQTGEVSRGASFVGSADTTAFYMSSDNLYVTYHYPGDFFKFFLNFAALNTDLIPATVAAHLEEVSAYNLSAAAKMAEWQATLDKWRGGLSSDEQMRVENEFTNRLQDYYAESQRDLEKTGILKLAAADLSVVAQGEVPGYLLNQFSLDETDGNLRLATTIGSRHGFGWQFGLNLGSDNSVSDVYVLDAAMQVIGTVPDLGRGERIYAVRFLGNRGYVVTFKETDPLYVIDLSNPSAPSIAGELKIPGYSSYLHPLAPGRVLGIGKEEDKVKLSVFDVSDATNPKEIAKYLLEEYWSEAINNHHAFLLDSRHEIFFMPGGQGGYIFGYAGDELKLTKAVADIQAKRALYLDDYLYVVGDDQIVVLDEKSWEKVGKLDFLDKAR